VGDFGDAPLCYPPDEEAMCVLCEGKIKDEEVSLEVHPSRTGWRIPAVKGFVDTRAHHACIRELRKRRRYAGRDPNSGMPT